MEVVHEKVVTSANPERVICVGKGVATVVENDLQALFPGRYEVIPQPNARLSSIEHIANFQRYYESAISDSEVSLMNLGSTVYYTGFAVHEVCLPKSVEL